MEMANTMKTAGAVLNEHSKKSQMKTDRLKDKNMRAKLFASVVAAAALAISAPLAHANQMLTLISGSTTVTMPGVGGYANYSGAVGGWNVNVTTGLASPADGGISDSLDLNSIDSSVLGTPLPLLIDWDATGYSQPGGYAAQIGGTLSAGISLTYATFYNGANALTAPLTFSASPFAGSANGFVPFATATPFDLAQTIYITGATAPGSLTSFDANLTAVPDGGSTLILLGGAITAMTLIRSKKSKK